MNSLSCIFHKISPLLHEKWRRTFLSETFWTIVFYCAGSKFIIRILSMSWDWDINSKQKECDKHRLALYLELLEQREMVPKMTPVLRRFCNTHQRIRCQADLKFSLRPTDFHRREGIRSHEPKFQSSKLTLEVAPRRLNIGTPGEDIY